MSDVTLQSLAGEHILDAVDRSTEQVLKWGDEYEQCEVFRFRLDGLVHSAVEDPSDGYRSCIGSIKVEDVPMKNVFDPVRVVGVYRDKYGDYSYHKSDVLELIAVESGKVVLVVGTSDCDDYYPSFVSDWRVENLPGNEQK